MARIPGSTTSVEPSRGGRVASLKSFYQGLVSSLRSFDRSFWAANASEVFERVAFYGMTPMLVLYLTETRGFSSETAIRIGGNFGLVTYGLAALSGILADAMGYRRALLTAYALLTAGYLAVGNLTSYGGILLALLVVAFGASLVKPVITGTVQKTGTELTRPVGFSVYYTLVNVGGFLGPNLTAQVRGRFDASAVFVASAVAAAIALTLTALAYREPRAAEPAAAPPSPERLRELGRDFLRVVSDARLMVLFVFVAGWWSMFFQFFNVLPLYLRDDLHAAPWLIGFIPALDAAAVILFQVVVGHLVRNLRPVRAILLAVGVSTVGVGVMGLAPSVALAGAGVVLFAVGEMVYSAHFYHYLGTLAPAGKVGMYMGFAFLPIALGSFLSGQIGAPVVTYFRETLAAPQMMWFAFAAVGLVSAGGIFLVVRRDAARAAAHAR